MLFTIDCVKLKDDRLSLYDFINIESDTELPEEIYKSKMEDFKRISSEYHTIRYSDNFKSSDIYLEDVKYNYDLLKTWYLSQNDSFKRGKSKVYKQNNNISGDIFTNEILSELYNVKNYQDENGIPLIKSMLANHPTYFFDIDMISISSRIVIEFLKNDTSKNTRHIENLTSHPMRYAWLKGSSKSDNFRKFNNLWKVKKILKGHLFLLNYSEEVDKPYTLIRVDNLHESEGFKQDIGYKITHSEFIEWLHYIHNNDLNKAQFLLNSLETEIRDINFWNSKEYKKFIGKNFKHQDIPSEFKKYNLDCYCEREENNSDEKYFYSNKLYSYEDLPNNIKSNFTKFLEFQEEILNLKTHGQPKSWETFQSLKKFFGDRGYY